MNKNASILIGILWTFWHVPLIYLGGGSLTLETFAIYLIFTISSSIIFSWLYFKTNLSLLLVGLYHGSLNTIIAFFPIIMSDIGQGLNLYAVSMSLLVAMLMVPYLFRRRAGVSKFS